MTTVDTSSARRIRVLILADSETDAETSVRELRNGGFDPEWKRVETEADFLTALKPLPDVILSDYKLPHYDCMQALKLVRQQKPNVPFLLISGALGEEIAASAIKQGADDYLLKNRLGRLGSAVSRALEDAKLRAERDRAEEALQESERQFRAMIEGAPYGIYRVTQQGKLLMVNPAMVAMLGYETEAEVLQLNMSADVYWEAGERERAGRVLYGGDPTARCETKWRRKDLKPIIVRLGGRQRSDWCGEPTYDSFVENITEQRGLELQFRQAQKMEAVGRLAGGIAHDFNNLLMVIGSSLELLGAEKNDSAKVQKFTDLIQTATKKAILLTRQLLAFSRQQILQPAVIDLHVVVQDLSKMLPRLLGEDIEIVMAVDPKVGRVRADRGQIEQVIMNLAVNARDAMPQGGTLTIEIANTELDAVYMKSHFAEVPPGRYVMLAVSDTGIGMDSETQSHIFEPFFTTKEPGKGTGLGLSTVYGIVKQSGGCVWLYSELGQGSTFKVYLPRIDVQADTAQDAPIMGLAPGGSETILLAEDEADLRELAAEYLRSKGYTVLEASDGVEALRISQEYAQAIDLLITDVVMPKRAGPELARAATQQRPNLRVIYLSGYTDRVNKDALGPGAVFLQKPLSLESLARMIRAVIDLSPPAP